MVKKIIFLLFSLVSLSQAYTWVGYQVIGNRPDPVHLKVHTVSATGVAKTIGIYGNQNSTFIGSENDDPVDSVTSLTPSITGVRYNVYQASDGRHINIEVTFAPDGFPPPPSQVYDFSDQNFVYSSTKDQLAVLQYQDPSTGEWKDAAARFIRGKASITDPDFSFGFGSYELPQGIENWNIKYSDIVDNSQEWQNTPHSTVWRGEVSDDNPTYTSTPVDTVLIENPNVSNITTTPSTNSTTTVPGSSISDQAGISNLSPSNTVENSAIGVAGGIKLAKGEIAKAVKEGVAGLKSDLSGKADQIISAINGINAGGSAATAGDIQNIVDGVGANETLESTESDFNSVSTNINSSAGHDAVDRMGGKLDTFLNDYQKPIFPQGFGSINSLSFTLFNSPVNLNFDQSMWATLRAFLVWLVYALSFFGLLKILRRGIA